MAFIVGLNLVGGLVVTTEDWGDVKMLLLTVDFKVLREVALFA